MDYYFSEEVKFLLMNHSDEHVELQYNSDPNLLQMPEIGARPPFYYNPRYVESYPII